MSRILVVLVAVLAIAASSVSTQAVTVSHNGGTVFNSGGFEADVVDALPANATLGTWDHRSGDVLKETTFGPASGGPGAATGDNYARVGLNGDGGSGAGIAAVLGGQTTGTLEATFKLYLDEVLTGSGLQVQMNYMSASNFSFPDRVNWVGAGHPDDIPGALGLGPHGTSGGAPMAFYDGAWNYLTTGGGASVMSIPYNTWVDVTASIDLDADTHMISVGGTTSDTIVGQVGFIESPVNGFAITTNFGSGLSGNFYVDAVPEPTSLVILAMALALGVGCRRRSR